MKIKYISDWHDSLNWCPSQLTRDFKHPETNKSMTLYCRWRHCDPWSFSFFDTGEHPKDVWVDIGDGLSEDTPIEEVHYFAECLLVYHFNSN